METGASRHDRARRRLGPLPQVRLAAQLPLPRLRMAGRSQAASPEAPQGGDFYDVIALDGGSVALILGDVCGKGMAAALHVPGIKLAIRTFLRESRSPARALARLNDQLCGVVGSGHGMPTTLAAVSLVVLDRATSEGSCCIGGADPPLILRGNGPSDVLPAGGMMLGVRQGEVYSESHFHLNPGDALLLVTDGITEARRGSEFLGYDGLIDLAASAWAAAPRRRHPRAVAQAIFRGARRFAGGPLHDDASVLVMERASG